MSPVELTPESLARRPEHILFREIHGEAVLFDPRRGTYFTIAEVGTVVWREIAETTALSSVLNRIVAEFEVAPEVAWDDLVRFVRELAEHGLIEIVAP